MSEYVKLLEGIAQTIVDAEKKSIELNEHKHFVKNLPATLRKMAGMIEKKSRKAKNA